MERAKYQEQAKKRKAFLEKHRKQLMIGIPAAVVLIIGIWLICKATIGPGGSIPNFFGKLQGVQDNWIVTNQGTTNAPRYYKMGEFTAPEGYTLDPEYNISSDKMDKTFYYTADDENAVIQSIYVAGVKNRAASEMVEMVSGYGMFAEEPTISSDPVGGKNGQWMLGIINDEEITEEEAAENAEEEPELKIGHVQMNLYSDSVQDSCVLIFMNSRSAVPAEEIPSKEEFLAEAEKILSHLTVAH